MILQIFKSLSAGVIVGVFFAIVNLPMPAPEVFTGIVGIFGIWLGYVLIEFLR